MSRYRYLEVFQSPLDFEITRIHCTLFVEKNALSAAVLYCFNGWKLTISMVESFQIYGKLSSVCMIFFHSN